MSFLDALCMMGDEFPYIVPVAQQTLERMHQISSLQLKREIKKGELTYVAALKLEIKPKDMGPFSPGVLKVL